MFGDNLTSAPTSVPPEMGISSAVKDLHSAVSENNALTQNLKECLGISSPDKPVGAGQSGNPSLVQMVRILTAQVYNNNAHLRDLLGHINS